MSTKLALVAAAALALVGLAAAACSGAPKSTPSASPRDGGDDGSVASMAGPPTALATADWDALVGHDGYPEPEQAAVEQPLGKSPSDTYPAPLGAGDESYPAPPAADGASAATPIGGFGSTQEPPAGAGEPGGAASPADGHDTSPGSPSDEGAAGAGASEAGSGAPEAAAGDQPAMPGVNDPAEPGQQSGDSELGVLRPDDDGYYPAPASLDLHYQVLALESSPHADLLVPMQAELERRDAVALAARVWDASGGMALTGSRNEGMAESWADAALAERHLSSFFTHGSQPLVQGYFEVPNAPNENRICADVLVTGWQGIVALPTASPGSIGPAPPDALPEGHATWRLCQAAEGQWELESWSWDGADYQDAVLARYADGFGPYRIVRPGMKSWPIDVSGGPSDRIRYGLDVPEGWYVAPGADADIAIDECDWIYSAWPDACDPDLDTKIEIGPQDPLEAQSMKVTVEEAKSGATETLLDERWTLGDGAPGIRLVLRIEPRGEQHLLLAVIGGHVIAASSWGDRESFDAVARTLRPAAAAPLP